MRNIRTYRVVVLHWFVVSTLSIALTGCGLSHWAHNEFKVGPAYEVPPAHVSENWIDLDESVVSTDFSEHWDWWSALNDPVLNRLIEQAHDQNLTLREAGWRVLQARARRAISVGDLYPQKQETFGAYDRIQASRNVAAPLGVTAFDNWATGFDASWEADVWGKFRRSVASSDAELDASVAEFDDVLVCLIAEVALAYLQIRTSQQRLRYAKANVETQKDSHKLSKTRANEGKTDYVSVHLSKSNLDGTRATIPALETELRQANNRLCTLLGVPPGDLIAELGDDVEIPMAPNRIEAGIPADLLRRRPDIRKAERELAAQSEQIGIAVTDLYPSFRIDGVIGVESQDLGNLFGPGSLIGRIGPSFKWKILNYGRIRSNVRLQAAMFEELAVTYQNAVITANQEVEDALVAFRKNQERVRYLKDSVKSTQIALSLELIRFEDGETDFNGIFVLQADLAEKQDLMAVAEGNVVASLIAVYKALGGGWEIRCNSSESSTAAEEIVPEEIATSTLEIEENEAKLPSPLELHPDERQPTTSPPE